MLQNYFKTTYRHLLKSKVNFIFKLGGLTLSLLSFLIIAIYVSYQLSFDRFHEDYENIYRVNSNVYEDGKIAKHASVSESIGPALKAEFPEVESLASLGVTHRALIKHDEELFRLPGFVEADSSIFDVFTFRFITGTKDALHLSGGIVLTESLAKQIFGNEDPLNKLIVFPDRNNQTLEVRAIVEDLPTSSHLDISAIMPIRAEGSYLYVRLDDRTILNDFLNKVNAMIRKNIVGKDELRENQFTVSLQPIQDIYLASNINFEFHKKGNALYVYIFSMLGFFLLIMASINYINLSIADFHNRCREIGVRKVLGARKRQIAFQVVAEAALFCLISLSLSISILYFIFPQVLVFLDSNLQFSMLLDSSLLIIIGVIFLFFIIISAAYPAYRLSINLPGNDLKTGNLFGKNYSIGKMLLTTQFIISIVCISATLIVGEQINYIKSKDIGFDRHDLITLMMPHQYPIEKVPVLKNEVSQLAGVEAASYSYYHITASPYYKDQYYVEIDGTMKMIMLNEIFVDYEFFRTMRLRIIEGRDFDVKNPGDMKSAFIVNETAVKEFGWSDPIGKRISLGHMHKGEKTEGTVVGVSEDFNTRSLHEKIEPLVMRLQYDEWPGFCLNVRIHGERKKVMASLKSAYEKVMPGYLVDFRIVEDMYDHQYLEENKAFNALRIGTWIIILISFFGIFSLSIYMSVRRMKEFGIRKVLGATVRQIAFLHVGHFLRIAFVANLIALPVAYWLMKMWLSEFAYRTELNGIVFMGVMIISFLLVILSAGYSSWRAGIMNPLDVIKREN